MQTSSLCRVFAALLLAALASCSRTSDNPYTAIMNPPLVQAQLHTVTLATDGPTVAEELQAKGYATIQFASNYPESDSRRGLAVERAGAGRRECHPLQGRLGRPTPTSACSRWRWPRAAGRRMPRWKRRSSETCWAPACRSWPAGSRADEQGSRAGLDLPDPRHRARLTSACAKTVSRWCIDPVRSPPRTSAITRPWPSARRTARSSSWWRRRPGNVRSLAR